MRVRLVVAAVIAASVLMGVRVLLPCQHEYSGTCTWYGPWQGNGKGSIVINWR